MKRNNVSRFTEIRISASLQLPPKILRISTTLRFVTAENRTLPARTIGRRKLKGVKSAAHVAGFDGFV
jgi:hypothetical protein